MKFQNRDTYPILKIPSEISKALSYKPTHEELFWSWAREQKYVDYSYSKERKTWTNHNIKFPERVKPLETQNLIYIPEKKVRVGWGKLVKFILFGCVVSFFLVMGDAPASFWFWFILLYVIGFVVARNEMILIEKNTGYQLVDKTPDELLKEKIRFNNETLRFKKEHDKYLKEIESDKKFVEEQLFWEEKKIIEANYKKLILAKSTPVRLPEIAKRGKSEIYFLEALLDKFGQNIHCDLGLKAGTQHFKPDFVYHHLSSGICIDIEIDEPYSFSDKLPIHYRNYADESRDNYFLSQNWLVIRFTEKQIIESRQACVDFIQDCIHCIFYKRDKIDLKVAEESKWSYEQALLWAKSDYRNAYLSKIQSL